MDILRNLFGNVTSGIIRLLVTVGVLAAAYFFIVKPVLNTTENVSNTVNDSIQSANQSFKESFGTELDLNDIDKTIENANKQVQIQIQRSFHTAKKKGRGDPQKLIRCIQRSAGDVKRIQRCTVKY
jgi:F0F1-type ATP synthase membrane subunit b/b'